MKIKKFRIKPRIPTVKKILKSLMGVKQLAAEIDETVPQEAEAFASQCIPVAFYQTWLTEEAGESVQSALSEAGFDKAISVSVMVATIGSKPEDELSNLLMNGETNKAHMVTALSEESADLSFNFLLKLLTEDAKNDDCEIGDPVKIKEGAILADVLSRLEASQEGVLLDQAGHLTPRFTRVALAAWLPVSKKRKQKYLSKKGK